MRIALPSGTPAELVDPSGDPAAGQPPWGLVLVPDIMGLRPLMDTHIRTLSEALGWPVCGVELWPGREHLSLDERLASVSGLDDADVLGDLAAAGDATRAASVAVLGFCMGGMYALKAAGSGRFGRAVAFYGMIRLPEGWVGPGQGEPLAALAGGHCPTLAIIGGADTFTPPGDVAALAETGVSVVEYPEAEHGFVHDPDRPAHRVDDAADAWRRALDFLRG